MRVLVLDQCSNAKNTPETFDALDAESIDSKPLVELQAESGVPTVSARQLYAGRQQTYVSEAVDRLRNVGDHVDRMFISAGFGVVGERERLPPYDVTFADYTANEIDDRAESLGIADDVLELINDEYDLIVFALGTDYYRSIDVDRVLEAIPSDTLAVLFNRETEANGYKNVASISARTAEAKEHGTIVVALKGVYLKNFAEHRANEAEVRSLRDVETYCTTEFTTQTGLENFD